MKPAEPILVVELFPPLHSELLTLLRALPPEAWQRPTVAAPWTVRDIVAHLLDTDIRRLSFQRDKLAPLRPNKPIDSYQALVNYLNQLNATWISAAQRVSPPLLIDFLAITGPQVYQLFASLDPFALAPVGVHSGAQRGPKRETSAQTRTAEIRGRMITAEIAEEAEEERRS